MAKNIVFRLQAETKQLRSELNQVKSQLKSTKAQAGQVGKTFSGLGAKIRTAAAAYIGFQAAKRIITELVTVNKEFEKSLSSLSAITGATGKDLEFFAAEARKIGETTTVSAKDAVKAFELIGSAKPELLKNKEALAAVTKEAIVLAEASGLTLPQAAEALTDSLNQFGAGAGSAAKFINVLAAGSKEGAAAIPLITEAIKEFGVGAASAGLSIEQSTAAIEVLAEKGLKGARAGNQLRNIFTKLQTGADNVNPKIVGLEKALENLAGEELTVTELTKQFGLENLQAAQILIENKDRLNELTVALTGTATAYEQAAIQTDNLEGDVDKLGNSWEGFLLQLNQGEGFIGNISRSVVQFVTDIAGALTDLSKTTKQLFGDEISRQATELSDVILKGIRNEAQESVGAFETMSEVIEAQTEVIKDYKKTVNEQIKESQERFDAQSKEIEQLRARKTALEENAEAQNLLTDSMPLSKFNEMVEVEERLEELIRERNNGVAALSAKIIVRSGLVSDLNELLKQQVLLEQELTGETAKKGRTVGDIETELKAAQSATAGFAVGSQELRTNLLSIYLLQQELAAATGKTTDAQKAQREEQKSDIKAGEIVTKMILDWLDLAEKRREEQERPPDFTGVEKAMAERDKAEQDAADMADELSDRALERIRQEREERKQAAEELRAQAFETANVLIAAQIAETEGAISAQEKRVEQAGEIADRGNAEQLQREEERLNELNRKKAAFVRRQQELAAIEIVANSAIAIAKAAAAGGPAAPFTIAATLLALTAGLVQARQIASTAAFAEGGYTGDGSKHEPAGTVHKGEFVFDKATTQRHRALFEDIHKGRPLMTTAGGDVFVINNKDQNERLERIERAILQQPGTSLVFDEKGVHGLVRRMEYKTSRIKGRA